MSLQGIIHGGFIGSLCETFADLEVSCLILMRNRVYALAITLRQRV